MGRTQQLQRITFLTYELKEDKRYKKDDNLLIEVIDNGPGMDPHIMENILRQSSDSHKFSKVGLNNVNQRIKLYFGSEFGLTIKSKREEGTKITITIPYK